jgi:hypothetical protein
MLAVIVLLTIVPPGLRPITHVPHNFEHAVVFLLNGLAFAFGYRGRELLLSIAALPLCAGLEIAQVFVPGRHARISDFAVDVIAALIGIAAGTIIAQKMQHSARGHQIEWFACLRRSLRRNLLVDTEMLFNRRNPLQRDLQQPDLPKYVTSPTSNFRDLVGPFCGRTATVNIFL